MPKALSAPAIVTYSVGDFNQDVAAYRKQITQKEYAGARDTRDTIVARAIASIEFNYSSFEGKLIKNRAAFETSSDVVQLGVIAATAVSPAGDVKDILTASLSGLQGTRLSIDKNFFEEKTSESLISQMRTDRKLIQARILSNLAARDVVGSVDAKTKERTPAYTLDDAWTDLVQFYYAGTVPSALISLAATTGSSAQNAAKKLDNTIEELRPATHAQAVQARSISRRYFKLRDAALGKDDAQAADAIKKIRSVLAAIGSAQPHNSTPSQLISALDSAMDAADLDHDKIPALDKAMSDAGVE